MLMVLSLLMIITFAVIATALFRLKDLISYLLSIYLLAFLNPVINGYLGHLLNVLNRQWFFLLFEALSLAVVILLWVKQGKPALWPIPKEKRQKFNLKSLWMNPDLTLLAVVIIAAMGAQIFLILTVAPNNNDSLAMHVPRVNFWLQHGNFLPWETLRLPQIFYPINAQLPVLWTVLFSNSWNYLGFPQFFSQIAAALAIAGIAGFMGIKKNGKIFAGLIYMTYPIIAAQSTTAQNDLVIGALTAICLYFFFIFLQEPKNNYLLLSGIALALAAGTKPTSYFFIPGMFLLWALAIAYKKATIKQLALWTGTLTVTFILFGALINYQNWRTFGNPLGADATVDKAAHATESIETGLGQVFSSSLKLTYQFIDPSGLPSPFWQKGLEVKADFAEWFFTAIHIDLEDPQATVNAHPFTYDRVYYLNEDEASFGIVGFLALLPFSVVALVVGIKQKNILLIAPFLLYVSFLVSETLFRPGWTPYQSRYFIPIAIASTPLLGYLTQKKLLRWTTVPLLAITGGLILANTILYNPSKPLMDEPVRFFYHTIVDPQFRQILDYQKIWTLTPNQQMGVQTQALIPICDLIEENIPAGTTAGYYSGDESYIFENCLFGEHNPRTVVPMYPLDDYDTQQEMTDAGIIYMVLNEPTVSQLENFAFLNLVAASSDGNTYIFQMP